MRGRLTKTMTNRQHVAMGAKGEIIYEDLKGLVSHDFQLVNEIGSIDGFRNVMGWGRNGDCTDPWFGDGEVRTGNRFEGEDYTGTWLGGGEDCTGTWFEGREDCAGTWLGGGENCTGTCFGSGGVHSGNWFGGGEDCTGTWFGGRDNCACSWFGGGVDCTCNWFGGGEDCTGT